MERNLGFFEAAGTVPTVPPQLQKWIQTPCSNVQVLEREQPCLNG